MDKKFSVKRTKFFLKNWKTEKNIGKVREFCQFRKVGTMYTGPMKEKTVLMGELNVTNKLN